MAATTALLLTVVGLALLWLFISGAMGLCIALMDRATQVCRDAITMERLHDHAQARQSNLQASRQKRLGWSVTDLDGQRRWLERTDFDGFTAKCRSELGLSAPCSWSELRRHWRRSSLRWHPDQGGDPDQWLRKQRAYDALMQLSRDPFAGRKGKIVASPGLLRSGRRRRWWT
jgi:hypothetical protein